MQKCLWSEIYALNGDAGCLASNEYLAKEMQVNEKNLRRSLAKLKEKGLIYQESFDGRVRVLRTRYPGH
jgi:DNA-binding IclR family transcriptional regulator